MFYRFRDKARGNLKLNLADSSVPFGMSSMLKAERLLDAELAVLARANL